jgi:aryl-alcohol dehydrogenase-like predicted oxidoreductase
MKLILGTAQFGTNYGVTNRSGQVPLAIIKQILQFALSHGVMTLDTALGYGNSETILGQQDLISQFTVGTKTRDFRTTDTANLAHMLRTDLNNTLSNLRIKQLGYLLIHNADDLITDQARAQILNHTLQELKLSNSWEHVSGLTPLDFVPEFAVVNKVGVSVYTVEQLKYILDNYSIDIVQLPFNVLDCRFESLFAKLRASGVEIHVRSIFLQGLLLNWELLPPKLQPYATVFNEYEKFLNKQQYSRLEYALYVVRKAMVDGLVLGVTALSELQEIIAAFNRSYDFCLKEFSSSYALGMSNLLDPRKWTL